MTSPAPNSSWFLFGKLVGRTARSHRCANFHVLCPSCGTIWASVEHDTASHWTCSHRQCPSCGLGTLVGADWTSQPYSPWNLPTALLVRELDIASSHPEAYTSLL